MSSLTGDGKFRNETLTIASLVVKTDFLEDMEFSNCKLIGPAVLLILNDVTVTGCDLGGPSLDALFWEVPPTRATVVGAVGVRRTIFSGCRFQAIGFAGNAELRQLFASGMKP